MGGDTGAKGGACISPPPQMSISNSAYDSWMGLIAGCNKKNSRARNREWIWNLQELEDGQEHMHSRLECFRWAPSHLSPKILKWVKIRCSNWDQHDTSYWMGCLNWCYWWKKNPSWATENAHEHLLCSREMVGCGYGRWQNETALFELLVIIGKGRNVYQYMLKIMLKHLSLLGTFWVIPLCSWAKCSRRVR